MYLLCFFLCFSYYQLSPLTYVFITSLDSISISNTVHEALFYLGWQNAMIEEMTGLDDNGTWNLVSRLVGKKVIGCKWMFAVKVNPDGTMGRLKVVLLPKVMPKSMELIIQVHLISLVAKLTSIRPISPWLLSITGICINLTLRMFFCTVIFKRKFI